MYNTDQPSYQGQAFPNTPALPLQHRSKLRRTVATIPSSPHSTAVSVKGAYDSAAAAVCSSSGGSSIIIPTACILCSANRPGFCLLQFLPDSSRLRVCRRPFEATATPLRYNYSPYILYTPFVSSSVWRISLASISFACCAALC